MFVSEESLTTFLVSSLMNPRVGMWKIQLSTEDLEEHLEGLEDFFGEEFTSYAATIRSVEIDQSSIKLTKAGTTINLKNRFSVLNPLSGDHTPIFEVVIEQQIYVGFHNQQNEQVKSIVFSLTT